MDQDMEARAVGRGEVLVLTQRSVRRRDYELRRGDEVVGWLRFPPARPAPTAVLLSLLAGFLALCSLQEEVDASGAIGGIVASGAG